MIIIPIKNIHIRRVFGRQEISYLVKYHDGRYKIYKNSSTIIMLYIFGISRLRFTIAQINTTIKLTIARQHKHFSLKIISQIFSLLRKSGKYIRVNFENLKRFWIIPVTRRRKQNRFYHDNNII